MCVCVYFFQSNMYNFLFEKSKSVNFLKKSSSPFHFFLSTIVHCQPFSTLLIASFLNSVSWIRRFKKKKKKGLIIYVSYFLLVSSHEIWDFSLLTLPSPAHIQVLFPSYLTVQFYDIFSFHYSSIEVITRFFLYNFLSFLEFEIPYLFTKLASESMPFFPNWHTTLKPLKVPITWVDFCFFVFSWRHSLSPERNLSVS